MIITQKLYRSLFLDSSNIDEIAKWAKTGIISGVTTNPLIMFKQGVSPKNFNRTIKKIALIMKGRPISVELSDSQMSIKDLVSEGKKLNRLATNIVVKVPMIPNSDKTLQIVAQLAKSAIRVNVTAMMTFEQMILATLAAYSCKSPSFVSLFYARSLEDHERYRSKRNFAVDHPKVGPESPVNSSPQEVLLASSDFITRGGYQKDVFIIAGSIRNAAMVGEAFAAGANIVTVTPEVLQAMTFSQRTVETLVEFDQASKNLATKK